MEWALKSSLMRARFDPKFLGGVNFKKNKLIIITHSQVFRPLNLSLCYLVQSVDIGHCSTWDFSRDVRVDLVTIA